MFCRAFEIQMTPSTRCPADGFESSHEKRGGKKEERQKHGGGGEAAGEQRGEISAVPKIDDSVEPKKDAKGEFKRDRDEISSLFFPEMYSSVAISVPPLIFLTYCVF